MKRSKEGKQTPVEDSLLVVPTLYIPFSVWEKMLAYVIACDVEINGFGYVDPVPGGYVVSDVFIIDQDASAGHVETDPAAMARMTTAMMQAGQDPGRIKFQWHSHVNMQAYFSGVDTGNIEGWLGNWLFSLVANKRGQYSCRLDILNPIRVGVDIEPVLYRPVVAPLIENARREVRQHVRVGRTGFRRRSPVPKEAQGAVNLFFDSEEVEFDPPPRTAEPANGN